MIDLENVQHHPILEDLTTLLSQKVQRKSLNFFRVEVAYFLAKMASSMRAVIKTKDRGEIPVNLYAVNLAPSGFGKGYSMGIMETEIIQGFHRRFMDETFPALAVENLWKLACDRALKSQKTEDVELKALEKEFDSAGSLIFSFDSGTAPAIKQMRQKLLLANSGAINLQVDEIGSNLLNITEVLNTYLELYDQGRIKQKLVKNTEDNTRGLDLDGKTPANALMFGTPVKLLDGGPTEDQFMSFLETGFARRCLFGWGEISPEERKSSEVTAEELYKQLTQAGTQNAVSNWQGYFETLADQTRYGWEIDVPDEIGISLLAYRLDCEKRANEMSEFRQIEQAEMSHRYFKALKLAGALAFADESLVMTEDHLYPAIKLVEESGEAFARIMNREKAYVKLARFIADHNGELTHADLHETLPFYKASPSARQEMMTLAQAWGRKQHIIIKRRFEDGIELFQGETLQETNLDELILSYSGDFAAGYVPEKAPFDQLHQLTEAPDLHWANHYFADQHRKEDNVIPGFNLLVIDVDGTADMEVVHNLLKDYTFMTSTTKRHTEEAHRFRLMLPLNYILELDREDYQEFVSNVMTWLPFKSDEAAMQRCKKWMTCPTGSYHVNHGELIDVYQFLPKTAKNEQREKQLKTLQSLDNLERWFAQRITVGNRNEQILKYALALVDGGMGMAEIEQAVLGFNGKLSDGLPEDELRRTVLKTAAKKSAALP